MNSVKRKFWAPDQNIIQKLVEKYRPIGSKGSKILEIGPGLIPFPLATHFVGKNEKVAGCMDIDIDTQPLPFEDQFFDLVYCRHVLEDIQNPDFALREMFRVGKEVYIETPSPLVEATKGVDGGSFSHLYCGYIHHRYLVWSNIGRDSSKNEIYFLPKYSCILDHLMMFGIEDSKKNIALLESGPHFWNNYWLGSSDPSDPKDQKPTIIVYKNGVNFGVEESKSMIQDYIDLVNRAIQESKENNNSFMNTLLHRD